MAHPWESHGEKRAIVGYYEPSDEIIKYLQDMQIAVRHALETAYIMAKRDGNKVPSPIALRREIKPWFTSNYNYAVHHMNPVCRAAVALLRSYKKHHESKLGIPDVKKLEMRIDAELFKVEGDKARITLQPGHYAYVPLNTRNKHFQEYSKGKTSELLITDTVVVLTFTVSSGKKPMGKNIAGQDLNFSTVDTTVVAIKDSKPELKGTDTINTSNIKHIQRDYTRRRQKLQKHIPNKQKRDRKIKETKGRQENRVNDALQKLSTKVVEENPDTTFVFEDLKGIRNNGDNKGKTFRTELNRWPYRSFQKMVEYKSSCKTVYVNPRGTSSECPVCGSKLRHPTWGISVCKTCAVSYDRNRLASLAITLRGLRLCGYPFTVSADASWLTMKNEYLYTGHQPKMARAGRTEEANAPNGGYKRL